jgi:hypothetical protein
MAVLLPVSAEAAIIQRVVIEAIAPIIRILAAVVPSLHNQLDKTVLEVVIAQEITAVFHPLLLHHLLVSKNHRPRPLLRWLPLLLLLKQQEYK